MIEYYGGIEIFAKSLSFRGVTLKDPDNCSISSHL